MIAVKALDRDAAALETTTAVIASLRSLEERDSTIDDLIAAIEADRARLLAFLVRAEAA